MMDFLMEKDQSQSAELNFCQENVSSHPRWIHREDAALKDSLGIKERYPQHIPLAANHSNHLANRWSRAIRDEMKEKREKPLSLSPNPISVVAKLKE